MTAAARWPAGCDDRGHNVGRHRVRRLMGVDGLARDLSGTAHSPPASNLSLSPAQPRDHTGESGLVHRYHLYSDQARVFVCSGDHGLAEPKSPRLAVVQYDGDGFFCVEALEEALALSGVPDIFNTDQGSQFTSCAFTSVLKEHGIKISMDGKGRWIDNVFIERLWRSLKYECVYLQAFDNGTQARTHIGTWLKPLQPNALSFDL